MWKFLEGITVLSAPARMKWRAVTANYSYGRNVEELITGSALYSYNSAATLTRLVQVIVTEL